MSYGATFCGGGVRGPRLERLGSLIIVEALHSSGVGVPPPLTECFERILQRPFECIDGRDLGRDHLRNPMRLRRMRCDSRRGSWTSRHSVHASPDWKGRH